jgi:hypothetical protein
MRLNFSSVQKKLDVPLKDDHVQKLLNAEVGGSAFLIAAGREEYFQKAGIPLGPSVQLAHLAQTIVDGESKCSFLADNPYHFCLPFLLPRLSTTLLCCVLSLYMHITQSQLTTPQGTANKAGLLDCPL